jgi:hypothetical protein
MEASKVKNGNKHLDILEIGKITVKRVLEYSFIKTEISMRECGAKIKDMDREHTGEMKMEN